LAAIVFRCTPCSVVQVDCVISIAMTAWDMYMIDLTGRNVTQYRYIQYLMRKYVCSYTHERWSVLHNRVGRKYLSDSAPVSVLFRSHV